MGREVANVWTISEPTSELIALEEARLHLKLDAAGSPATHPDDDLVDVLITAARQAAENFLNAKIGEYELELRLANFASEIAIPDRVVSIDSVTYIDTAGATQTVSPADYELAGTPAAPILRPVYDGEWPTDIRDQDDAVRVRYTTGYSTGSPNTLPAAIRAAMLLTIGHLYANRQAAAERQAHELPLGVTSLLMPYRRQMGV
jgi:uncharacterized phiE125 gp8 family phage protein